MTMKIWLNFKRAFLRLAILVLFSPLFAKNVTNGAINFSMSENGKKYVKLDGDWEFYVHQTFTSLLGSQLKLDFIVTPSSWTKKRYNKPTLFSDGCHTYRIVINGLRPNFEYAIFSRQSPSNSALIYSNGRFIAECGKFSRHRENYKAAKQPLYNRLLSDEKGEIELVIQAANFSGGQSGIVSPIFFGENAAISKLFQNALLLSAILQSGLVFIFLLNLFYWIFDNKKIQNLCFAVLIFFISSNLAQNKFNLMGLLGTIGPYGLYFKWANLTVFSSAILSLLLARDKSFSAHHPHLDKIIAAITFSFMILFICLPERLSIYALDAAIIWSGLYGIYSIFRFYYGLKTSQTNTAKMSFFYTLIAFPFIFDHFWAEPITPLLMYSSEFAVLALIFIDIVYIAANQELTQKKLVSLKNEFSKYHIAARKFIPRNFTLARNSLELKSLGLGSKIENKTTIVSIGFAIISPDNTPISLRDNFESTGFYSATIIDQINKHSGSVVAINNDEILSVFSCDCSVALDAAHEIRDLLQTMNARRAEDYYPCISFTIAIHLCDALLGIVGDRNHTSLAVISSGIEVTEKMKSLGSAMNIPILISEPTFERLDFKAQKNIKLLGRIHFSEFTRPIGLYGLPSNEEEENSLENIDDAPFITQLEADKYINF